MPGIDLSTLIHEIENAVHKKISKGFETAFTNNLLEILKSEGRDYILKVFVEQYDILTEEERSQFGSEIRDKDPSALENFRHLFVKQISKELDEIKLVGDHIEISVGDSEAWYPKSEPPEGEPETVDFLGYYLEGFGGEVGFITMEHWRRMRGGRPQSYGRFGKGFLMDKETYLKEKWDRRTKISFDQIRHPISGQRPFKGFHKAAASLNLDSFVQKAIEKTFREIF